MSKYSVFFFIGRWRKNVNELLIRGLKVDWGEIAPHLYIWDYVTDFVQYCLPVANWKTMQPHIQDFRDNHVRIAKATSYAIKKGVFVSNGSGNYVVDCANLECGAYWWLRSAGFNEECASIVRTGGDISSILVTRRDGGVRPALWLKY